MLRDPKVQSSEVELICRTCHDYKLCDVVSDFACVQARTKLLIINDERNACDSFAIATQSLLHKMLASIDLNLHNVSFASIVNSSYVKLPPTKLCKLTDVMVLPQLILALGKSTGQLLLNNNLELDQMRGICHKYQGVDLRLSYNPAYLLKYPEAKKYAYDDLLIIKKLLY